MERGSIKTIGEKEKAIRIEATCTYPGDTVLFEGRRKVKTRQELPKGKYAFTFEGLKDSITVNWDRRFWVLVK